MHYFILPQFYYYLMCTSNKLSVTISMVYESLLLLYFIPIAICYKSLFQFMESESTSIVFKNRSVLTETTLIIIRCKGIMFQIRSVCWGISKFIFTPESLYHCSDLL